MKAFLRNSLIVLLILFILGAGARHLLQNKILQKIQSLSSGPYRLSASSVSLEGLNQINIIDLVIYRNKDTVATLRKFEARFEVLALLDNEIKLQQPVLYNLHVSWKEPALKIAKQQKQISNQIKKDLIKKNPDLIANLKKSSDPIYSGVIHPQLQPAGDLRNFKNTENEKPITPGSLNYFPQLLKLIKNNLEDVPEKILILEANIEYEVGGHTLRASAEKITLYPLEDAH